MATSSGILPWKILCTEESGTLESMGSQRVGHAKSWTRISERARARTHTHTAKVVYKSKGFSLLLMDEQAGSLSGTPTQPHLTAPLLLFALPHYTNRWQLATPRLGRALEILKADGGEAEVRGTETHSCSSILCQQKLFALYP